MITKRQALKETTTGSDKHAAAKGGGEGMRQRRAGQDGERDRRAEEVKGCERRGDDKQCVRIYARLILLTFHGQYCFVTDRDEVRGGRI